MMEHSHGDSGFHIHHSHDHSGNFSSRGRFILVIIFNIIITAAEFAGGVLSGSLALISDAGHNLSDVLSLILGYTGEKVSERGRSKKYSFGMKRFEVLVAFINAFTLILIGIYIFYESVERLMNPQHVDISIMIPVALIGLAGNVFSILVLQKHAGDNLNMKAAFLHLIFDAISSVAVIAAGMVIYFTSNYWIDVVISFFIAVMIIWSSMGILRESLRIFLQGVPSHIDPEEVNSAILGIRGVISIHGLHIWSINSKEVFLSCHICIDNSEEFSSDVIIEDVNAMLSGKFQIDHTTIQVELGNFCRGGGGTCCG